MTTPSLRPARARSLAEKKQRREDILQAAEHLWSSAPYAELSMSQVASASKLAKGTLYLYFDTKEELFLALVDTHLDAWTQRTAAQMDRCPPTTPAQLADVLVRAGHDATSLRRLLVLLGTVLERRVRPELLRDFRLGLRERQDRLLALMPLERPLAERVMRHLYALAIGWQHLVEEPEAQGGAGSMLGIPGIGAPQGTEQTVDQDFELAVRAVIERLTQGADPA